MDSMPPIDSHADLVRDAKPKSTRLVHVASDLFHGTEQLIYIALGVLLSATVLIALAGSGRLLWGEMQDWTSTDAILELIDRLLIVLMLIEILYTVRVSMQTGTLKSEPFSRCWSNSLHSADPGHLTQNIGCHSTSKMNTAEFRAFSRGHDRTRCDRRPHCRHGWCDPLSPQIWA
jgi:hypothetical protein